MHRLCVSYFLEGTHSLRREGAFRARREKKASSITNSRATLTLFFSLSLSCVPLRHYLYFRKAYNATYADCVTKPFIISLSSPRSTTMMNAPRVEHRQVISRWRRRRSASQLFGGEPGENRNGIKIESPRNRNLVSISENTRRSRLEMVFL